MTASAISLHTKDGAGGVVSGGYEFGDGVRVENELSYSERDFTAPYSGHDGMRSDMINFLYSLPLDDNWHFEIGGGFGVQLENVHATTGGSKAGNIAQGTPTFYGPQAIAGLSYKVLPNVDLFADYHYQPLQSRGGDALNGTGGVNLRSSDHHTVMVGLRFSLSADSLPSQQASVPPPPSARVVTASALPPGIVPGSIDDFKVNVGDIVHFEYNEYNIDEEDKNALQKQATWLNRYPSIQIIIEGHCDERGTREYNLALGARRANAVKEYLVRLGVNANRLQTVSYGKERPLCNQASEDCGAQNRRGVSSITSGAVL